MASRWVNNLCYHPRNAHTCGHRIRDKTSTLQNAYRFHNSSLLADGTNVPYPLRPPPPPYQTKNRILVVRGRGQDHKQGFLATTDSRTHWPAHLVSTWGPCRQGKLEEWCKVVSFLMNVTRLYASKNVSIHFSDVRPFETNIRTRWRQQICLLHPVRRLQQLGFTKYPIYLRCMACDVVQHTWALPNHCTV